MRREDLVKMARVAGQASEHNLMMIAHNPDRMIHPQQLIDGIRYLNMMIAFSEREMQNARRVGRASLKTIIKNHLKSILNVDRVKSKGELV